MPPEDVGAMVGVLRELAGDREALADMGRRGRRFVLADFDRRALAGRYARVLEDVVAGRRGRG